MSSFKKEMSPKFHFLPCATFMKQFTHCCHIHMVALLIVSEEDLLMAVFGSGVLVIWVQSVSKLVQQGDCIIDFVPQSQLHSLKT